MLMEMFSGYGVLMGKVLSLPSGRVSQCAPGFTEVGSCFYSRKWGGVQGQTYIA